jgi:hypothetical protein
VELTEGGAKKRSLIAELRDENRDGITNARPTLREWVRSGGADEILLAGATIFLIFGLKK